MGIHTKPDNTREEMNFMVEVYDYLSRLWKLDVRMTL